MLLFVDNASSHPDIKLSNVRIKFLPPNTTAELQPMDQGVIRAFKALYRRWLLTHIIQKMESACSVTELTKLITVLQAIYWIDRAWGDTKESTIQKCFRWCGFVQEEPEVDEEEEDTTDHVLLQDMINHVTGGGTDITEEDYLAMDDDLPTEDNTDQCEQNLLETIMEYEDNDDLLPLRLILHPPSHMRRCSICLKK